MTAYSAPGIKTEDSFLLQVSKETGISIQALKSKSRKREIAEARMFFTKLAFENTAFSLEYVGKIVNRDHATVLHARKTIDNLKEEYPEIKAREKKLLRMGNFKRLE